MELISGILQVMGPSGLICGILGTAFGVSGARWWFECQRGSFEAKRAWDNRDAYRR
jgi:hypothetical protein